MGTVRTCVPLAVAMMRYRKNWRVLVIDLDPQGDLSKLMGWNDSRSGQPTVTDALASEDGRLPVYKSDRGVYFVPATLDLQNVEPEMMKQMQKLKSLIRNSRSQHSDLMGL